MTDDLEIIAGPITMYGRPGMGPYVVGPEGLDGWDDSVTMRANDQPRPLAGGSYELRRFPGTRTITISGIVLSETVQDRELYGGRMQSVGGHGGLFRVQVKKGRETLWVEASTDDISVDRRRGSTFADFKMTLWCPDGRRFGKTREEPLTAGVSRSLYHYGTNVASPLVVIPGPVAGGYTLASNEGQAYRVNAPIAAGSTHTIDMNDGLLRVNGKVQAGLVGRADIWDIPPGLLDGDRTLNMAIFPDSGSAVGTVLITDTYY